MNDTEKPRPLLRLLQGEGDDGPADQVGWRLRQLAAAMDQAHLFRKGQLVKWKAGLKNRISPAYDEPAIVREILETPVYGTSETNKCDGSPYFQEPLTIIIGIIDRDNELLEFRVDGRRFEPFQV